MSSTRASERTAGLLYLLTHVTSVGAVALYGTTRSGVELRGRAEVLAGGVLEVVLAAAIVGAAVALYPVLRTYSPGGAVAYVGLRTLEASVVLVGVVALLPVVGAPGTTATPGLEQGVADALRLVHDWTFLVGPGLVCPVNTVVLALVLFRHRLVPRWIPVLGLVGGPLIGLVNLLVLAGVTTTQPMAALPIFAWEVSLAVWLIARGLRSESDRAPVPEDVATQDIDLPSGIAEEGAHPVNDPQERLLTRRA